MQSHTLYAQTISELGTFGVVALLAIIVCYVLNYRDARRLYRAMPLPNDALFCYRVLVATAIALAQLLFLGLGGHDLFRFVWIWYGAFAAMALKFLKAQYADAACDVCVDSFAEPLALEEAAPRL